MVQGAKIYSLALYVIFFLLSIFIAYFKIEALLSFCLINAIDLSKKATTLGYLIFPLYSSILKIFN